MDSLNKILLVTRYTFVEIIKSKIMILTAVIGMVLLLVSFIGSEFTYGVPERVALDFGMGMLTISAVAIAIFMGVTLISKEIETRTVHMILARPVTRWSFLLGRMLGISSVLFLNISILGILTIAFYLSLGGNYSSLLIWSLFFAFLESLLMLMIVVFFSLLTNMTASVIYSVIVYFSGHGISELMNLTFVKVNSLFQVLISGFGVIIPDLSKLNIKNHLVYNVDVPLNYLIGTSIYSLLYFCTLILITVFIFNKKSLD